MTLVAMFTENLIHVEATRLPFTLHHGLVLVWTGEFISHPPDCPVGFHTFSTIGHNAALYVFTSQKASDAHRISHPPYYWRVIFS